MPRRGLTRGQFAAEFWVPPEGFELADDLAVSDQALTDTPSVRMGRYLVPQGTSAGEALPFNDHQIHIRFGGIRSARRLRQFVNKYGFVGHPLVSWTAREGGWVEGPRCESVEDLLREARALDRLLMIHALVKDKSVRLARYVRWTSDEKVDWNDLRTDTPGTERLLLADKRRPDLLGRWTPGDFLGPAEFYVCLKINQVLREHVRPHLLPYLARDIMLVPDCLLAAIYVSFALQVSGKNRAPIQCQECGELLVPGRSDRRFCSNKCKQKAHRRSRKETGK